MNDRTLLILALVASVTGVPIIPGFGWVMVCVLALLALLALSWYNMRRSRKRAPEPDHETKPQSRKVGGVTLTVDEHGNVLDVR